MPWDPRKDAGEMCNVWNCRQEGPGLHAIVRRCVQGHRVTFMYCGAHIDEMMALALRPPGLIEDGTILGKLLCRECPDVLDVVLEEMA